MWHESRVRQFLLPCLLATAFAVGGCSSPAKKLAKQEKLIIQENSRATEERRMRAINYGDVRSERGAQVLVYDPNKVFDPSRSDVGAARTHGTGGARTKDFNFQQKASGKSFLTRAFAGSRSNSAIQKDFATREADTRTRTKIPGAAPDSDKIAATKDLPDGDKAAETRGLHDGTRFFLGRERTKLYNGVDPKKLADWRSGGGETVIYNADGSADRIGNLKQLSLDDVRELLNKNK
jgi:hypothetical protein